MTKKPTKAAVKKAILEMFLTTIESTLGVENVWSEDEDGGRVMINARYKDYDYSFQFQRNYLDVISSDIFYIDEDSEIVDNGKMLEALLEEKLEAVIAYNEQKSGICVS